MAVEIIVPRLGWSMDEGAFSQWLKQDGDVVQEGDSLFELESDKAVQQVESFDAGILRIPPDGPEPGDIVKVGQRLGYLCGEGEATPIDVATRHEMESQPSPADQRESTETIRPAQNSQVDNGQPDAPAKHRPTASPSARRLARQLGVDVDTLLSGNAAETPSKLEMQVSAGTSGDVAETDEGVARARVRVSPRAARAAARLGVNLSEVSSTGTSGRISERDVLAAVSRRKALTQSAECARSEDVGRPVVTPEAAAEVTSKDATLSFRRTIATRMLAAAQQTAAVTLTATADASELVNVRKQLKSGLSNPTVRTPGFTGMFVKLAAAALERHPAMLGQWSDEGIVVPDGFHVAVAVDTPLGLLTPVVRDVPSRSLAELSEHLEKLVSRARARRLSPEDLRGGTFTVTNLGGYRVDAFTPLLNLPQAAILGVGRISPQPVAIDERVEVRNRVSLSLTFDHRVVDGATAAALLTTICELVESPLPTLLS